MRKISRSALLEVPVELAYQVVMDVEAYPGFLPGCDQVEVLSRTDEGLRARVRVSGAGMRQSFVTANQHLSNCITMSLVEGPFKSLEGVWHFQQIGEHGCRVLVDLEFDVDLMLGMLLLPMADVVANKLVDSFCQRMDDLNTGSVA